MFPLLESQGAFLGESLTQAFTVPSLGGGGTTPPSSSGGDSVGVCVNFGQPCQVFSECCSGRCASGVCRTSNSTPRQEGSRIGATTQGGAAPINIHNRNQTRTNQNYGGIVVSLLIPNHRIDRCGIASPAYSVTFKNIFSYS
jgi:hypothetical protein